MHTHFSNTAIRLAVLSLSALPVLFGQAAVAQTPQLKEITVTGNPLGATDLIAPSAQYSGDHVIACLQRGKRAARAVRPSAGAGWHGTSGWRSGERSEERRVGKEC